MSTDAAAIVRVLVDLGKTVPHGDKLLRDVRDGLSKHVLSDETLPITLISPSGHEPHLKAAVHAIVESKRGCKAEIVEMADPTLIGGAVLQIGDEQIDLSVRGSLNELEASLRSSPVSSADRPFGSV